jgi:hypothetical protein
MIGLDMIGNSLGLNELSCVREHAKKTAFSVTQKRDRKSRDFIQDKQRSQYRDTTDFRQGHG